MYYRITNTMKNNYKFAPLDFLDKEETREEWRANYIKDLETIKKTIKQGKIYAKVNHVSKSGMSRDILFYRIRHNEIENITPQIAWLTESSLIGEYKEYQQKGLRVSGCGMDMIMNTLYNALPYKQSRKWSQNYRTL